MSKQRGLVWGTIADAIRHYKGSPGREGASTKARALPRLADAEPPARGEGGLPVVALSRRLAADLEAKAGDLVYITDTRSWLGGLRSAHAVVGAIDGGGDAAVVEMGPQTYTMVVSPRRRDRPVAVERLY